MKTNIILSILLVLSLGYAGFIKYTDYQKNQEELRITQKRSPQCYNTGQYRVLRFYKENYYHFIYIHRDNIVDYFKTTDGSAFVQYLDFNPESKCKCTKVSTINFTAKYKLKEENLIDDLRKILTELEML